MGRFASGIGCSIVATVLCFMLYFLLFGLDHNESIIGVAVFMTIYAFPFILAGAIVALVYMMKNQKYRFVVNLGLGALLGSCALIIFDNLRNVGTAISILVISMVGAAANYFGWRINFLKIK